MSPTALSAGIITGGIFVMGLVVAGTLSDYRDAERAPTDLASGLYAILREGESMHAVWRTPDLSALRTRLIAVVTTLRADIDAGDSRTCQAAIEDLSETFVELDESDVPANYIVRLRAEQAGLRKSLLRIYHLQREEFLPSAYAMIVAFVSPHHAAAAVHELRRACRVPRHGRLPLVLLPGAAAAAERDQHSLQGRDGADRRRREPVPAQ
jgi:hypothetical protein